MTKYEQDIIQIAEFYGVKALFNDDGELVITYKQLGMGSIIAGKINDLMHEKYPEVDYSLSIKHGDMTVVVRIGE